MHRRNVTIVAAVAILSAGWLVCGDAKAGGGATSAPSKFDHATQTAAVSRAGTAQHVRHETAQITEFSSSSATNYPHAPKR